MKSIFEGKTCKAEYNAEQRRIEYTFDGYPNVEEHKAMYMEAMEFLRKNVTRAFLMDFRKMSGSFTMLNDWVIEFFRPAIQLGLKRSAMVLNNDVFTQFAANDALGKVKILQIQVFKDIDTARVWTEEV